MLNFPKDISEARILISNDYYPALRQPQVEVVNEAIREVTERGIVTADGQRGMWEHPDLEPEQAAATVAKISPRPTRAVAVFDGEIETADGPRPAVAVEAFDAAALASTRMVFPYLPGVAAAGIAARVDGDPQVVANGPNPLFG